MTRRHWRLGSGIVLWVYVAGHLANHALGLVSLSAAERGLGLAVAVWHSLPGTALLYCAFAIHISLALEGLYQRQTLRLPPLELVRIGFGLTLPLLLIGHFVVTRAAFEMYGLPAQYQRVVLGLVNAGSEGRQLALLAPGWLHGCMGLNVALRHRQGYVRWRWLLLAFACALPLLAAAGFLVMGQEVAMLAQDANWVSRHAASPNAVQAEAMGELRSRLLACYLGLIAVVVAARGIRYLRTTR